MSQNTSSMGEAAWSRNATYVGSLLIIAAWTAVALTGCRFGNRVVKSPDPENPDKITGLYDTQPQKLAFYAQIDDDTLSADATPTSVPSLISQYLTNPTALIMEDLATGAANFLNPYGDGKSGFPITVGSDKSLTLNPLSLDPTALWTDEACVRRASVSAAGALAEAEPHSVPGFTTPTSGRIGLTVQYIEIFDGDCKPSLTAMRDCYNDVTACGGSTSAQNQVRQEYVQDVFGPYIESHVISDSDLPDLDAVAYEVQYE